MRSKKRLVIWGLCSLVAVTVFADNLPFLPGSAPKQVYHNHNGANQAPNAGEDVLNTAGIDTSLQTQLLQLNQRTLLFQQQSDERMALLDKNNQSIANQVKDLNQMIVFLTTQVTQLRAVQEKLIAGTTGEFNHSPRAFWQEWLMTLQRFGSMGYWNIGIFAVLLLMFGFLSGRLLRRSPKIALMTQSDNIEEKSDYDFMTTHEAVPAMLDLARSYVAMEEYQQARDVLRQALEKGNSEQKTEANDLLQKIK